jgi:isocitrate dehydrogenase
MFKYLGWEKVHDLIWEGLVKAVSQKKVTYDFHRLMENATLLKCSEFGDAIIKNM